jgi:hypothetical protein
MKWLRRLAVPGPYLSGGDRALFGGIIAGLISTAQATPSNPPFTTADPGMKYLRKPYDRERRTMMVRRVPGGPAKTIEDPNEPKLDSRLLNLSRQINEACPTRISTPS